MWRVIGVALVIGALLLGGCSSSPQTSQEIGGVKVETNANGSNVTITGADGEKFSVNENLPAELKEFPVPDGFESQGGGTLSSASGSVSAISWKGKSSVKDVSDFYKNTMESKGWKSDGKVLDMEEASMHSYTKGNVSITLTIAKEDQDTVIAVLLGDAVATPEPTEVAEQPTPEAEEATPTPEKPKATPTPAAPETVDASKLPEELKDFPAPSGFGVKKDSTSRATQGGKLLMATAAWVGKGDVAEITDFLEEQLKNKGWTIDAVSSEADESLLMSSRTIDGAEFALAVGVNQDDDWVEIMATTMPAD